MVLPPTRENHSLQFTCIPLFRSKSRLHDWTWLVIIDYQSSNNVPITLVVQGSWNDCSQIVIAGSGQTPWAKLQESAKHRACIRVLTDFFPNANDTLPTNSSKCVTLLPAVSVRMIRADEQTEAWRTSATQHHHLFIKRSDICDVFSMTWSRQLTERLCMFLRVP